MGRRAANPSTLSPALDIGEGLQHVGLGQYVELFRRLEIGWPLCELCDANRGVWEELFADELAAVELADRARMVQAMPQILRYVYERPVRHGVRETTAPAAVPAAPPPLADAVPPPLQSQPSLPLADLRTEAKDIMMALPEGRMRYKVIRKAAVHEAFELDSEQIAILATGDVIEVHEHRRNENNQVRIRTDPIWDPPPDSESDKKVEGWASIASRDGKKLMVPVQLQAQPSLPQPIQMPEPEPEPQTQPMMPLPAQPDSMLQPQPTMPQPLAQPDSSATGHDPLRQAFSENSGNANSGGVAQELPAPALTAQQALMSVPGARQSPPSVAGTVGLWLEKKSPAKVRGWQKRWFVFSPAVKKMLWYNDPGAEAKGVSDLKSAQKRSAALNHCFRITSNNLQSGHFELHVSNAPTQSANLTDNKLLELRVPDKSRNSLLRIEELFVALHGMGVLGPECDGRMHEESAAERERRFIGVG